MSTIVGIDLDALKTQADALKQQLADIDTVIRIAAGMSPHVPAEIPAVKPQPQPERNGRKINNRGARKAVLLALYTGSASTRDLAKALVWNHALVCDVVYSCEDSGLVEGPLGGALTLTEKGRTIARWFLENPQYMMYTPWRLKLQCNKVAQ